MHPISSEVEAKCTRPSKRSLDPQGVRRFRSCWLLAAVEVGGATYIQKAFHVNILDGSSVLTAEPYEDVRNQHHIYAFALTIPYLYIANLRLQVVTIHPRTWGSRMLTLVGASVGLIVLSFHCIDLVRLALGNRVTQLIGSEESMVVPVTEDKSIRLYECLSSEADCRDVGVYPFSSPQRIHKVYDDLYASLVGSESLSTINPVYSPLTNNVAEHSQVLLRYVRAAALNL
jgi:hypothetical protein